MGHDNSKPETNVKGNNDLTIVQTQNIHTEQHEAHEFKLNLILALLALIVIAKALKIVYKIVKNQAKEQAVKMLSLPK